MKGLLNVLGVGIAALLLLSWSIILYPGFWSKVRDLGLPVPYCTTNELAVGCEYRAPADYAMVHKVATADPLVVAVTTSEPVDFLNTLCARSREGHNVLAIVNTVLSDSNTVAASLVSCGVKVKRAYVRDTIAVSPAGLLVISPELSLFTDCNKAVSYELTKLQERWRRA